MANRLIFLNNVIYALSKDFGFRVDLYRKTGEVVDLKTGKKIINRFKYKLKKVIILPNDMYRDFKYSAILASLNTNLQAGGLFDTTQRIIIINKKQLPKKFELQETDYFIFNHIRYNIVKFAEMELIDYWQILMKQVVGEPTYEVHEAIFREKLCFDEYINNGPYVPLKQYIEQDLTLTHTITNG
jgi:hypothetical protein